MPRLFAAASGTAKLAHSSDGTARRQGHDGARTRVADAATIEVAVVEGIDRIAREDWNALLAPTTTAPSSIGTGCSRWRTRRARRATADGARAIWRSHRGKKLVAACPLYLKSHSMGEFVFDQGWADAAERSGIRYYPKLLAGVPFTPHGGRRFLTAPGVARRADDRGAGPRADPALRRQQAFLGARQFLPRRRSGGAWRTRFPRTARLPVPLAQHRLRHFRRLPGSAQEQAPLRRPP